MKQFRYLLLINIISSNILFGSYIKELHLTHNEINYLKNKKELKICVDPSWMPFEGIIDGKYTGLGSDYMNIISKKINTPIQLVITKSWDKSLVKARNRECDLIPIISDTNKRREYLNLTQAFLNVSIVLVTKNKNLYIDNIEQIIDKKIAIVKDYSIGIYLKEDYPNIKIIEVKSIADGLKKVDNGEVFAYIDNVASVNYELQKDYGGILYISGRLDRKIKYQTGVRNDDQILYTIINKTISSIGSSQRKDIFNRWATPTIETKIDYKLVWYILFIALLLVGIIFYRQKMILKYNKKLKLEIEDALKKVKQKDKAMLEQSRLAQMGEMMSMIAHQWRQPLTAISATSGNLTLKAKLDMLDNETVVELGEKISEYSQHLSGTINDFRDFFKPNKDLLDITYKELVKSVLSIIEDSLETKNIELKQDLKSEAVLSSYPNELKQVILNLLKNAEDILLEKEIEHPTIIIETEDNILRVRDNAGGVPKDIIEKVFDPYFSTKTQKDGTGLGLYMSKTIIEEHCAGELRVYNDELGAVFEIKLPLKRISP